MTSTEVIKILIKDGWFEVHRVGSHIKYNHPSKKGYVTVAHHKGKDIPKGTLNKIWKQAGLK